MFGGFDCTSRVRVFERRHVRATRTSTEYSNEAEMNTIQTKVRPNWLNKITVAVSLTVSVLSRRSTAEHHCTSAVSIQAKCRDRKGRRW
jgi:hypothetical protein